MWRLFCLCLSAMIEVGQYVSGRRVADVDDLILNTLGGLLGYLTLRYLLGRGAVRAAQTMLGDPARVDEDRPTGS